MLKSIIFAPKITKYNLYVKIIRAFFPIFALRKLVRPIMKIAILSIFIVLFCVLLMGVKVLFVKGSRFPSGHVHSSPELRKRGISCASSSDKVSETVNSHLPSKPITK